MSQKDQNASVLHYLEELPTEKSAGQPSHRDEKDSTTSAHFRSRGIPFDATAALVRTDARLESGLIPNTIKPLKHYHSYLISELRTDDLDSVLRYLWLAGLPAFKTRPLHSQRVVQREIVVCERIGLHLVSFQGTILIKPLPHFLMHHLFYQDYIENIPELEPWALGFLASYLALIVYESDYAIAKQLGLLPPNVTWKEWLRFAAQLHEALSDADGMIIPFKNRYFYGELRLSRLNLIMQIIRFRITRGYIWLNTQYSDYFRRYFTVIALLFAAYFSVALSAFQVATGAGQILQARQGIFQVAYWFSIGTLVVLGATIVVPLVWFTVLLIIQHHYIRTAKPGIYERRESIFLIRVEMFLIQWTSIDLMML